MTLTTTATLKTQTNYGAIWYKKAKQPQCNQRLRRRNQSKEKQKPESLKTSLNLRRTKSMCTFLQMLSWV